MRNHINCANYNFVNFTSGKGNDKTTKIPEIWRLCRGAESSRTDLFSLFSSAASPHSFVQFSNSTCGCVIGSRDDPCRRPCCHGVWAPFEKQSVVTFCSGVICCSFLSCFKWIFRQNALKIPKEEGFLHLGRITVGFEAISFIFPCDHSKQWIADSNCISNTIPVYYHELVLYTVNCSKLKILLSVFVLARYRCLAKALGVSHLLICKRVTLILTCKLFTWEAFICNVQSINLFYWQKCVFHFFVCKFVTIVLPFE